MQIKIYLKGNQKRIAYAARHLQKEAENVIPQDILLVAEPCDAHIVIDVDWFMQNVVVDVYDDFLHWTARLSSSNVPVRL